MFLLRSKFYHEFRRSLRQILISKLYRNSLRKISGKKVFLFPYLWKSRAGKRRIILNFFYCLRCYLMQCYCYAVFSARFFLFFASCHLSVTYGQFGVPLEKKKKKDSGPLVCKAGVQT